MGDVSPSADDGRNRGETQSSSTGRLDRRDYLKLTGGAIVGATLPAAMGGTVAGSHGDIGESSFPAGADVRGETIDSLSDRGWTVVDVASHVDNSGNSDVSGFINDNVSPETVFKFRAGTYFLDSWIQHHTDKVAFVGVDGADPTIEIDSGFGSKDVFNFGYSGDPASGFVLRNLNIDMTDAGAGAGVVNIATAGQGAYVKNVDVHGQLENTTRSGLSTVVVDSDAVLSVHDFNLHDGSPRSDDVGSASDSAGIIATKQTVGDVHLGNCKVAGFPNNGVYASKVGLGGNPGTVIVRGGEFFNSDRDQLRVGSDSEIHHAHCYSDTVKSGFNNLRGIWIRHGEDVLVNDVNVTLEASAGSPAGVRVGGNTNGRTRIRNSHITLNTDSRGVLGRSGSGKIVVDDTVIESDGSASKAVRIFNHSNSVVKNSCIEGTQDGVVFEDHTGTVTDSTVTVSGTAVQNASTSNVSYDGRCSSDSGGSGGGDPMHDITFSGGNVDTFDYYFRATDSVEAKSGIGGEDDVSSDRADGSTTGTGTDAYHFEGDVAGMALDLGGYMTVNVDRSERTITIEGVDDGYNNGYYLEVTGDLYRTDHSDDHDVDASPNGDSVNGLVGSGTDEWEYSGELSRIGLNAGTATVDVTRRHKLEIEDYQDGVTADYEFSVSGSLEKGRKANDSDDLSGTTADGQVTNGTDSYVFTGRITDWEHSGAVHTYVDGEEVITPSLGNNLLTLTGTGSNQNYSFGVVGGLGAHSDVERGTSDIISGRTADGVTGDGYTDTYSYRNGVRTDPDKGGTDISFSSE